MCFKKIIKNFQESDNQQFLDTIDGLNKQLTEKENALQDCSEKRKSCEETLTNCRNNMEMYSNQVIDLQKTIENLNEQITSLQDELAIWKKEGNPDVAQAPNIFKNNQSNVIPYFPKWRAHYWDNGFKYKEVEMTPSKFYRLYTDEMYQLVKKTIKNMDMKKDFDKVLIKLRDLAYSCMVYKSDFGARDPQKLGELWKPGIIGFYEGIGDCVADYEEIWMADGTTKKIKDLQIGEMVLSYDLNKKEYVNKPIINIWDKGELPIKRVHFRNGNTIDITENHPMWVRKNSTGMPIYEKTYLSEVDLNTWYKRKVPSVIELPYIEKDIDWLNEDLCFVIGHFFAEGWVDKGGKVGTCGYDIIDDIIPLLEKNNIPFTEGKNGNGVPVINFLKSDFKDYLRKLKKNSFHFTIPNELRTLPKNKLQKILDGHFLGDGHYRLGHKYELKQYSTSSDELKEYLCEISMKLGRPLYSYYQLNHQGAGHYPIWRLDDNPNSDFRKNRGYDKIGEVSISYIEELEPSRVLDFEVEDTHTFVFKNGIISHQCEDMTTLWVTFCFIAGIPADRVFNCTGVLVKNNKEGGHSFGIFLSNDGKWKVMECTAMMYPFDFKGSNYYSRGGIEGLSNWQFSGFPKSEQF